MLGCGSRPRSAPCSTRRDEDNRRTVRERAQPALGRDANRGPHSPDDFTHDPALSLPGSQRLDARALLRSDREVEAYPGPQCAGRYLGFRSPVEGRSSGRTPVGHGSHDRKQNAVAASPMSRVSQSEEGTPTGPAICRRTSDRCPRGRSVARSVRWSARRAPRPHDHHFSIHLRKDPRRL